MMSPVRAFLQRFAAMAHRLWLGRIVGSEGWQLRRRLRVSLFTPRQLTAFARLGARAQGLN